MNKIRLFISEKLLSFAFSVSPSDRNGNTIMYMVGSYFDTFKRD